MKRFLGWFDLSDLLIFGGLGLVGYGISLLSVPIAWIVVGMALFFLGIFTAIPRISRSGEKQ
jgi:hypothetical protein